MQRTALVGMMLSLLIVVGCNSQSKVSDRSIVEIDHAQLASLVADANANLVVVDVRPAEIYATGHLPGSVNRFLPTIAAKDPRLVKADHIVVCAQNSRDTLGPAAAKRLLACGYDNVLLYRGGVDQWTLNGGQITTD